jgi:hypothetical protein
MYQTERKSFRWRKFFNYVSKTKVYTLCNRHTNIHTHTPTHTYTHTHIPTDNFSNDKLQSQLQTNSFYLSFRQTNKVKINWKRPLCTKEGRPMLNKSRYSFYQNHKRTRRQ